MSTTSELRKAWQSLNKAGYTVLIGKFDKIPTMFIPGMNIMVCWRKCWVEHCMVCLCALNLSSPTPQIKETKNCLKLSSNLTITNKNDAPTTGLTSQSLYDSLRLAKNLVHAVHPDPLLPRHLLFATAKHHHALRGSCLRMT